MAVGNPPRTFMVPWTAVARRGAKSFVKPTKKQRRRTLRFSLWKPSPFALCLFSFKSCGKLDEGCVARGRHLMVPELSSGATEVVPKKQMRNPRFCTFWSFIHFRVWILKPDLGDLECVGCVWCAVDAIRGRFRARQPLAEQKRPQSRCVFPYDTTHVRESQG